MILVPTSLLRSRVISTSAREHDARVKIEEDAILILDPETLTQKDEVRRAELLADPRQAAVEPGRVLCKMCNTWIKLNASGGYLPGNWRRHASRCQKNGK